MGAWEYATVPLLVHATKEILDNWGEDGWELVTVLPGPNPDGLVGYFKRQRSGPGESGPAVAGGSEADPMARLAELGLTLPVVTAPLAAYLPAVRTGDLVFVSGQLPVVDGRLLATGRVGEAVSPEAARELARRCALNALGVVGADSGLANVVRVVKVVGFVACVADFTQQPEVVDGASELFGEVFGAAGRHARSAVGVEALPRNAPVEIEVVFEVHSSGITG